MDIGFLFKDFLSYKSWLQGPAEIPKQIWGDLTTNLDGKTQVKSQKSHLEVAHNMEIHVKKSCCKEKGVGDTNFW